FTVADDSIETTTSTDPNFWWNLIVTNSYNSDVIFDRCYIHGRVRPSRNNKGFYWAGHNMAIVDSYLEHMEYWHATYTGLAASGSGTTFSIAPGTFNIGTTSYTLRGPATVTLGGAGTGVAFVYYDMAGN